MQILLTYQPSALVHQEGSPDPMVSASERQAFTRLFFTIMPPADMKWQALFKAQIRLKGAHWKLQWSGESYGMADGLHITCGAGMHRPVLEAVVVCNQTASMLYTQSLNTEEPKPDPMAAKVGASITNQIEGMGSQVLKCQW